MKYELDFMKTPKLALDPQTKKPVMLYTARFEVTFFDSLGAGVHEALGDGYFIGFTVLETTKSQRVVIEYVDQVDAESTALVNTVVDDTVVAWQTETGATTWA